MFLGGSPQSTAGPGQAWPTREGLEGPGPLVACGRILGISRPACKMGIWITALPSSRAICRLVWRERTRSGALASQVRAGGGRVMPARPPSQPGSTTQWLGDAQPRGLRCKRGMINITVTSDKVVARTYSSTLCLQKLHACTYVHSYHPPSTTVNP